MKIKIEHINNTYNYGSLMMAVNTINKIKNEFNDLSIYCDAESQNDLDRLRRELGYEKIYIANKIQAKGKFKITRFISKLKQIKEEGKKYDANIVLGGDDISEYYGKNHLNKKFLEMYFQAKSGNLILLGQTVGPFTEMREKTAKIALNKTLLYVRDTPNLEYLNSIGINKAKEGRDLAFLELPNKNNNKMFEKYNLVSNKYITMVPSGLAKCYTSNYSDYVDELINIVSNVLNNKKLTDYKIVLLTHVIAMSDDRKVINDVITEMKNRGMNTDRIIAIVEPMLASEARYILGNGYFTITGRMHAAVSTFFERKPALSLSYSVKYAGVIGDGLKRNDLVIECAGNEKWLNKNISNLVNDKIDYIIENYNTLVNEIDLEVSKTTSIVEEELKDVVKYLKNKN